jgi:LemA protein
MPGPLVIIAAVAVLALAGYVIVTFNRLAALSVRADNAWSDIDVQLRKRWDLVPRLVETVGGYARHERARRARGAGPGPRAG